MIEAIVPRKTEAENEMWLGKGKLHVSINKIPEFRELLEKAKKEAQQLNQTIQALSCFTIEVDFSTDEFRDG